MVIYNYIFVITDVHFYLIGPALANKIRSEPTKALSSFIKVMAASRSGASLSSSSKLKDSKSSSQDSMLFKRWACRTLGLFGRLTQGLSSNWEKLELVLPLAASGSVQWTDAHTNSPITFFAVRWGEAKIQKTRPKASFFAWAKNNQQFLVTLSRARVNFSPYWGLISWHFHWFWCHYWIAWVFLKFPLLRNFNIPYVLGNQ